MTDKNDARTVCFLNHYLPAQERIRAYIFSLLHNWSDTQDVFQSVSLVLWKKFDQFDPARDFLPWAYGVTFLEVRTYLRSLQRKRLLFNDVVLEKLTQEQQDRVSDRQRRSEILQVCLGKLQGRDRELIRDAYSGHSTIKVLAAELERPVQTIYNRLNQLRRRLMQCIERQIATEGIQG